MLPRIPRPPNLRIRAVGYKFLALLIAPLLLYYSLLRKSPSPPDTPATLRLSPSPPDTPAPYNKTLLDGCTYVYLDIGTNLGVQIRKLFEPSKYPNSAMLPRFKQWFGGAGAAGDICAIGFEPNPTHFERLNLLEQCYQRMGWRVNIFRAAAYSEEGNVTFATDDHDPTRKSLGARVVPTRGAGRIEVPAIDIARFIREVVAPRKIPEGRTGFVGAKFDIEGAEYPVLEHLYEEGDLCQIDAATIEWHFITSDGNHIAPTWNPAWGFIEPREHQVFRTNFPGLITELNCPSPITFEELDDELYLEDGKEWPRQCRDLL